MKKIKLSLISTMLLLLAMQLFAQEPSLIAPNGRFYCAGPGVVLAVENSVLGQTYTLQRSSGANWTIVTSVVGNGNQVNFQGVHGQNTYRIQSLPDYELQVALVAQYTVSGGGSFCLSNPTPRPVQINGSQLGVNYVVRRNLVPIDTIPGVGGNNPFILGTYDVAGTYTVIASPEDGDCVRTMLGSAVISEFTNPSVDFTYYEDGLPNCANVHFEAIDMDGTGPFTFDWDFGYTNNPGSDLPDPTHYFPAYGAGEQAFEVTLIISDANGCTFEETKEVNVTQRPDASLASVWTYDPGEDYPNTFAYCNATDQNQEGEFEFENISTTQATNTWYFIEWGDGSAPYNNDEFEENIIHTYVGYGNHDMIFTVTGQNGCVSTTDYTIYIGNTPSGGVANPGNLYGVAPYTVPIEISSGTYNNSPGTSYYIDFGDGNDTLFYELPEIPVIYHTYIDCSTEPDANGRYGYTVYSLARNPCSPAESFFRYVIVSCKATADFEIENDIWGGNGIDTLVACNTVHFNNTSTPGFYIPQNNNTYSTNTFYQWNFGDPDSGPDNTTTLANPVHTFTYNNQWYEITLVTYTGSAGANSGRDTIVKYLYIQGEPEPQFAMSEPSTSCVPVEFQLTDLSDVGYGVHLYNWQVQPASGWQIEPGPADPNPLITFNQANNYNIRLQLTNSCGTAYTDWEPVSTFSGIPSILMQQPIESCGPATMILSEDYVTYNDHGQPITSWNWSVNDPALILQNPTGPHPTIIITNNETMVYYLTVEVENECGIRISNPIPVSVTQAIDGNHIGYEGELVFCGASTLEFPIIGSESPALSGGDGEFEYQWFIHEGESWEPLEDQLEASLAYEPIITNNPTMFKRIVISGHCIDEAEPVVFTVLDPIENNLIENNASQNICSGEIPEILIGSLPVGGTGSFEYTWQQSLTGIGGWTNASGMNNQKDYTPPAITANVYYRRLASSGTCISQSDPVEILVYSLIEANEIQLESGEVCYGLSPGTIIGSEPIQTNVQNFDYQWQSSTDGVDFEDIPQANQINYTVPPLTSSVYFRRIVMSSSPVPDECSNSISDPLFIGVNENPVAIATAQNMVINYGTATTLMGDASDGSLPYQWHWQGPVVDPEAQNTSTLQLFISTTFTLEVVDSKGCIDHDVIEITVVGSPLEVDVIAEPEPLCIGEFTNLIATASGGNETYSYSWSSDPPGGTYAQEASIIVYPEVSTLFTVEVFDGFSNASNSVFVTVYGDIQNNFISAAIDEVCHGLSPGVLIGSAPNQASNEIFTFQWQSSTDGAEFTNITGGIQNDYSPGPLTQTTWFRRIVYAGASVPDECNLAISNTLLIEVLPNPDVVASATSTEINYGTSTTLLGQASGGQPPYQWNWSGPVVNPSAQNTLTQQLFEQTNFILSVTDNKGCSQSDDITINVVGSELMVDVTANPEIICLGSSSNLQAIASGGNEIYTYSWSSDPPGGPYPPQSSITITPQTTTTFYIEVSDGFSTVQNSVIVIVNQLPIVTSSAVVTICSGDNINYTPAASIAGSGFMWSSVNNTGGCVTGNASTGSGMINDVLINTCNSVQSVYYNIIPIGPPPSNCEGAPFTLQVRVNPVAHITNNLNSQTVTSGQMTSPVTFTSGTSGVDYSWSSDVTCPDEIIYTYQQGNGAVIPSQLVEIAEGGPETCTVAYQVVISYDGCLGVPFTYNIIVNSAPSVFNVGGGGTICAGESTVVTLDGSDIGIIYQLLRNGNPIMPPQTGTGNTLIWTNITLGGTYTVRATNPNNGVSEVMGGSAIVVVNPLPIIFNLYVQSPGDNCLPIDPWLNGSQTGVRYQLNRTDPADIEHLNIQELIGTGLPLLFNTQFDPGTYYVSAFLDYDDMTCTQLMTGVIEAFPMPEEFPLIPQGIVCEDTESVCMLASEHGIVYQLWLNNQPVPNTTIVGTGGDICFGPLNAPGIYQVHAKHPITLCEKFFSQTITVEPIPEIFTMQPLDACAGSSIQLNGCQPGIDYYLYFEPAYGSREFVPVFEQPFNCSGNNTIDFGVHYNEGSYRVKAVNPNTNCFAWMENETRIHPSPEVFDISPQGFSCPPVEIGLDNSQPGVTYYLYRNGIAQESAIGTGGAITFTPQLLPGLYTVKGSLMNEAGFACWADMTGQLELSTQPELFTLLPAQQACPGVAFYLNGSEVNVIYQLWNDQSGLQFEVTGTGGIIYFNSVMEPGQYWVIAIKGGCQRQMSGVRTVLPPPNVYNITPGSGSWCLSDNIVIGLDNSDVGVRYELHRIPYSMNPLAVLTGTGDPITFENAVLTQGIYRIKAVDLETSCEIWMDGQVELYDSPLTYFMTVNGNIPSSGTYCPPIEIGLNMSQPGILYTLHTPDQSAITVTGAGTPISFGVFSLTGPYTVTAINPNSGCTANMQGTIIIIEGPQVYSLSPSTVQYFCEGDPYAVEIILNYSEQGVFYQLYKNTESNPVLPPQPGVQGPLFWNNVSQFGPGSYFVKAYVANNPDCSSLMSGIVITEEVPLPVAGLIGSDIICQGQCTDLEFMLQGSLPMKVTYTANGLVQDPVVFTPGNAPYLVTVCPDENTLYEIISIEYDVFPNCDGQDISGQFLVTIEPLPLIIDGFQGATCVSESYTTEIISQNTSAYQWHIVSGNGSIQPVNTQNTTYTPAPGDEGGVVILELTAWGTGSCSQEFTTAMVEISIGELPVIDVGPDGLMCENGSFTTDINVALASSYLWEVVHGNGYLSAINQMNTTYFAAEGDANTSVVLKITASGVGSCLNAYASDFVHIQVEALPFVEAGPDDSMCTTGNLQLDGYAEQYDSLLWEVIEGGGVFNDPAILNPIFIPEIVSQPTIMKLKLTAFGSGICQGESGFDELLVRVDPLPVANGGEGGILCDNQGFHFAYAYVSFASSFIWQIYDGEGYFDDPTLLSPVFYPADVDEITEMILMLIAYGTDECQYSSDTSFVSVMVYPQPIAFAGDNGVICVNIPYPLQDAQAAHYSSVVWEIQTGNGYLDDPHVLNPNYYPHTNDAGTTVTLQLKVFGNGPCAHLIATSMISIQVLGLPQASAGPPLSTCYNESVMITQASASNYSSLSWSHDGNGILAGETTLQPVYTPGEGDEGEIVHLTLTVYGADACDGEMSDSQTTIQVTPLPSAFAGNDAESCGTALVYLEEATAQNASSIIWSIVSGNGVLMNPFVLNTYYQPSANDIGNTVVLRLAAFGQGNCSSQVDYSFIYIDILQGPQAFFATNSAHCLSEEIQFEDLSTQGTGSIMQWIWDFGDGSAPMVINYPDIPNVAHVYTAAGEFIVELTAIDQNGCENTYSSSIIIHNAPIASFETDGGLCAQSTIHFINLSDENGSGSITQSYWDFGDGNTSLLTNPVHTYNSPGVYQVQLQVINEHGCLSAPTVMELVINEALDVSINATSTGVCISEPITFSTDVPGIYYWLWNFGDGNTSVMPGPTHYYQSAGSYVVTVEVSDQYGCVGNALLPVTVYNLPSANFTFINSGGCIGDLVSFTDQSVSSNGVIVEWTWDLGDGTIIVINDPANRHIEHIYNNAGTYYVTLMIEDIAGCVSSFTQIITIAKTPLSDFVFTGACQGQAVFFTDLSSPNGGTDIVSWFWDFGDPQSGPNNTSNLQNPTHTFMGPMPADGYTVQLTVTNSQGCSHTQEKQVLLPDLPSVEIIASSNLVCLTDYIVFNGVASNVVSWIWNFGDGNSSNLQNPVHTYLAAGTYIVSLTVATATGCSNTATQQVVVRNPPVAGFMTDAPVCLGDPVHFTNTSVSPNGQIVTWIWDFGDGNTVTIDAPDSPNVEHTYDVAGTFHATLTAIDNMGCEDHFVKQVIITNSPVADFTFSGSCFGLPVDFFDLSSTNSGPDIFSWQWNFGDPLSGPNNQSHFQNPSHVFTAPGIYNVTLIVTNTLGCSDTFITEVNVHDLPQISFSTPDQPFCSNQYIEFSATGENIISWHWQFGDGGTSFLQNPTYIYSEPGTYQVTLTAIDIFGCQNAVTQSIQIQTDPIADFQTVPSGCMGTSIAFENTSTTASGFIQQWIWNFGDGSPELIIDYPDNPNVVHTFGAAGTFNVTLTVLNNNECSHSKSRVISITPAPLAAFTHGGVCANSAVNFNDLSQQNGGGQIVSWHWDFGDPSSGVNNTSTLQNPTHTYASPGNYQVTLTVTNTNGCQDSFAADITINEPISVSIEVDQNHACFSQEFQFTGSSDFGIYWYWDFGDGNTSTLQNPTHTYSQVGTFMVTLTAESAEGCSNTDAISISVYPSPMADFINNSPVCANEAVDFTDISVSPNGIITEWLWDFGDGNNATSQNPSHTYQFPGMYDVSLIVTDAMNCSATKNRLVQVSVEPVANFIYSSSCQSIPVNFTDLSSPNGGPGIYSWSWEFGDPQSGVNNTSTLQNPSHLYVGPMPEGGYEVTLTITNATGCTSEFTDYVLISPLPEVNIQVDNENICSGELIQFNGMGQNIVSWFWQFGDGGHSTLQNPSYTYSAPGNYLVSLTATDLNGCVGSANMSISVGQNPVANFTHQNGCLGASTQFTDQSTSPGSIIVAWEWSFGDGNGSTEQNPVHVFESIGDFMVTLVVTNIHGCEQSLSKWVSIYDVPQAAFSMIQVCDPPGKVLFFDESQPGANGSPVVGYNWHFHGNYYSSHINPTFIFQDLGHCYTITLSVTDYNGCTGIVEEEICVWEPLSLMVDATEVCFGEPTIFEVQHQPEEDDIVSFVWKFNDGSPSIETLQNTIEHIFATSGHHTVELVATNQNGCSKTTYKQVRVNHLPIPDFSYVAGICNEPTRFTDLSNGNGAAITNWYWDFGDGHFSEERHPMYVYDSNEGQYQVTLTVTNLNGCVNSYSKAVIIDPCLQAFFTFSSSDFCAQSLICFEENSLIATDDGVITNYEWDFGDGNQMEYTAQQSSVCHTYGLEPDGEGLGGGVFEVSLKITAQINGDLFTHTHTELITIWPKPTARFIPEPVCQSDMAFFVDNSLGNGATITQWKWTFGDDLNPDDTASLSNPYYRYAQHGVYDVQLIVKNAYGCADTLVREIEVWQKPEAQFSYELNCKSLPTYFMDESAEGDAEINQWRWRFGNGLGQSNQQFPEFVFNETGSFPVTLTVTDGNQCSDTLVYDLVIYPTPTALFNITDEYQGRQGNVLFNNLSAGASYFYWDFDDGYYNELDMNPVHQFAHDGTYELMLIAYNEFNCPDTTTKLYNLLFTGLYFPNTFVPSSSNPELNRFMGKGENLISYHVEVLTATGQLVYSSSKLTADGNPDPEDAWDGKYKGVDVPTGSYVWRASAVFKDGTIWKGSDNGDGNLRTYGILNVLR